LHAIVDQACPRIGAEDTRQVCALVPQLGRFSKLAGNGRDEVARGHRGSPSFDPEPRRRDPLGQDASVVATAMDRARVGRHTVLDESLGGLSDRAGEEDSGQRGALPPRGHQRQAASATDGAADRRQVEQRRHEPGRRDDIIDLDHEIPAAVGPTEVDGQAAVPARRPLDPVEGGIEDRDPAAEHVVLVRLDVPGAHPRKRAGLHGQLRGRWRDEQDLARPRQQPVGQLETGVLLAEHHHATPGVRVGGAHLGVVMGELHADSGRGEGLGDADRDHKDLGPVLTVARGQDEP
jgi:hypothetical protein